MDGIKAGDKYLVSVVTPYYNVDLDLFEKCADSLKAQTIGFENIEWVVVVHNSKPEYLKGVRELVGDCPNVNVLELNNDLHTPSSPRNYGLDRINGSYVGFLDADDTYTPECLEKVIKAMLDTQAQIAAFRFETDSEDENRLVVNQFVMIDQTKEVVVLEKGTWDSKQFIYGAALNVTSKVYDRHFLDETNHRFDVEVPFAEDNLFNLGCYGRAERICFLPQLIGYVYFLNGGSMVQSFTKTVDEVRRYANGILKIFDTGLASGLYMNSVMWDLLGYQSVIMLASYSLTLEDRRSIKEMLVPYMKLLEPLQVSKLYTKDMIRLIMTTPKLVLNHPRLMCALCGLMKLLRVDIGSKIRI